MNLAKFISEHMEGATTSTLICIGSCVAPILFYKRNKTIWSKMNLMTWRVKIIKDRAEYSIIFQQKYTLCKIICCMSVVAPLNCRKKLYSLIRFSVCWDATLEFEQRAFLSVTIDSEKPRTHSNGQNPFLAFVLSTFFVLNLTAGLIEDLDSGRHQWQ